jgi:hypothetical protein
MKPELQPRRSRLARRKHDVSFDERLWRRLGEVANRHYQGNRSRALEGLLMHDWLVELNKQRAGKPHTHWISAPLVMNDGELEPLLDRLEQGEADEIGCYVDRLVEERIRQAEHPESLVILRDELTPPLPGMAA